MTWSLEDAGIPTGNFDQMPYITEFDQIDSLDCIAYGSPFPNDQNHGRFNIFFRTTDGGAKWDSVTVPTTLPIIDASFSDAKNGILVVADTIDSTFVTSDGGAHWRAIAFRTENATKCHDYGNGMYRVLTYGSGRIYTTRDAGKTVDSTEPIPFGWRYIFSSASFGGSDSILAYGNYINYKGSAFPCIARTTDGGRSWSMAYGDTTQVAGSVYSLSDIGRDTILAGISQLPIVLLSTDHGASWQIDTVICPDTSFIGAVNYGIGFNSQGALVGSYSFLYKLQSSIIMGTLSRSSIFSYSVGSAEILFPNPATSSLTLLHIMVPNSMVYLVDLLGRTILIATIPVSGTLTLDVSHLPRGMYEVMLEKDGRMVPAGKVILQ